FGIDVGLLAGEVTGDDERRRQQVHFVFAGILAAAYDEIRRFFDLALFVFDDAAWSGGGVPAVGDDQVQVVGQGVGAVVHQALVDGVAIQQRLVGEAGQQVFGQCMDQRVRFVAGLHVGQRVAVGGLPGAGDVV